MPNYFNPYQQFPQMQMQSMQPSPQLQNMQQPQIQNGGFVSVRNEGEARNYPVAPGNSITFKDETAPYVYTKTMGFSQLDRPIFEKFKLVKEEVAEPSNLPQNEPNESKVDLHTIEGIKSEIKDIWSEIELLKDDKPIVTPKKGGRRKEVEEDE